MAENKPTAVEDMGTHCSFGECGRLDFLPIRCDLCSMMFCREHSSYMGHRCEKYVEKPAAAANEEAGPKAPLNPFKCSFEGCTNKEMLEVVCEFCRLNFCMKHRLQCDHNCAKKLEEDRLKEEAQANRRPAPKEFKFEMKNVSDKNAALAAKVMLMKLKQSAQGPPGLTDDLKYFCHVEYANDLVDSKAASGALTKKPFFFSTKWPVGRCVEFVLEKLGIPRSNSTKLRLFIDDEVFIDSSKILGDFIKEATIPQGLTLGLKDFVLGGISMGYTKSSQARYFKYMATRTASGVRKSCHHLNDNLPHPHFKMVLPPVLRDFKSGQGANLKPTYECVPVMNTMINCLKQSDYNEEACGIEISAFLNCVKEYQKVSLDARDKAKAGIFTSDDGITRYPKAFIDKMLKKYKTPRKVDDGPDIPV